MKKAKFKKFFEIQDVLNYTLKFLPLYQQIKIIFLNKTILNYYLNDYHGVFNGSLEQIYKLLKSINKFLDQNQKTVLKNISSVDYFYILVTKNDDWLLQNLKPHTINFYAGISHSRGFVDKVKEMKIKGGQFLHYKNLTKFKPNLYLEKLSFIEVLCTRRIKCKPKICVNCDELFIENSLIGYINHIFLFKNVKKLYLKNVNYKEFMEIDTIEELILDKVTGNFKNLSNLKVLEIKNSNISKDIVIPHVLKRLKIYNLKDVFWLLKTPHIFKQIITLNLCIIGDWIFETFSKRNEFFKLLIGGRIKNLIISIKKGLDPYIVFRECVKIEGLVELKLLIYNDRKLKIEKVIKQKYYKKIKILIENVNRE